MAGGIVEDALFGAVSDDSGDDLNLAGSNDDDLDDDDGALEGGDLVSSSENLATVLGDSGDGVREAYRKFVRGAESVVQRVEEGLGLVEVNSDNRILSEIWTEHEGSPWLDEACRDMIVCLEDTQNDSLSAIDEAIYRFEMRTADETPTEEMLQGFFDETQDAIEDLETELSNGQIDLQGSVDAFTKKCVADLKDNIVKAGVSLDSALIDAERISKESVVTLREGISESAGKLKEFLMRPHIAKFKRSIERERIDKGSEQAKGRWAKAYGNRELQGQLTEVRIAFDAACDEFVKTPGADLKGTLYKSGDFKRKQVRVYKAVAAAAHTCTNGIDVSMQTNFRETHGMIKSFASNLKSSFEEMASLDDADLQEQLVEHQKRLVGHADAVLRGVSKALLNAVSECRDVIAEELHGLPREVRNTCSGTEDALSRSLEYMSNEVAGCIQMALNTFTTRAIPQYPFEGNNTYEDTTAKNGGGGKESMKKKGKKKLKRLMSRGGKRKDKSATSDVQENSESNDGKSGSSEPFDSENDFAKEKADGASLVFGDTDEMAEGGAVGRNMNAMADKEDGSDLASRIPSLMDLRQDAAKDGPAHYLQDFKALHPSDTSDEEDISMSKKSNNAAVERMRELLESMRDKEDRLNMVHKDWKAVHESYAEFKTSVDGMIDQVFLDRSTSTRNAIETQSKASETCYGVALAEEVLKRGSKDPELKNKAGFIALRDALADVGRIKDRIQNVESDREVLLRLFQSNGKEEMSQCIQVLKAVRVSHSQLRADYRMSHRKLKDCKRGMRLHGSIADIEDEVLLGKSPLSMSDLDDRLKVAKDRYESLGSDMSSQLETLEEEKGELITREVRARLYLVQLIKQYSNAFNLSKAETKQINERYTDMFTEMNLVTAQNRPKARKKELSINPDLMPGKTMRNTTQGSRSRVRGADTGGDISSDYSSGDSDDSIEGGDRTFNKRFGNGGVEFAPARDSDRDDDTDDGSDPTVGSQQHTDGDALRSLSLDYDGLDLSQPDEAQRRSASVRERRRKGTKVEAKKKKAKAKTNPVILPATSSEDEGDADTGKDETSTMWTNTQRPSGAGVWSSDDEDQAHYGEENPPAGQRNRQQRQNGASSRAQQAGEKANDSKGQHGDADTRNSASTHPSKRVAVGRRPTQKDKTLKGALKKKFSRRTKEGVVFNDDSDAEEDSSKNNLEGRRKPGRRAGEDISKEFDLEDRKAKKRVSKQAKEEKKQINKLKARAQGLLQKTIEWSQEKI